MKKILLLILTAAGLVNAQIPNAGFENWSISQDVYDTPTDWESLAVSEEAITKVSGVEPNTFAVKLITTVNLISGDTIGAALAASFSVPGMPTMLKGYYKSDFKGLDSGSVMLMLSNKIDFLKDENPSGFAYKSFGGTKNVFTYFEIPVFQLTTQPVDTAFLFLQTGFLSSNTSTPKKIIPGSTITFDQLTLEYAALGIQGSHDNEVFMYPNPTSNFITVSNLRGAKEFVIQDLSGAVILQGSLHAATTKIDLQTIAAGTYVMTTKSNFGSFTSKLVIK